MARREHTPTFAQTLAEVRSRPPADQAGGEGVGAEQPSGRIYERGVVRAPDGRVFHLVTEEVTAAQALAAAAAGAGVV